MPAPAPVPPDRAYLFPSPGNISFDTVQGVNPATLTATVAYLGSGSSGWRVTTKPSWLTVTPSSGPANTTTTVTLQVSATALAPGFFPGTLTFQDLGTENQTSDVFVNLFVSSAPPGIPAVGITDAARLNLGGPSLSPVSLQDQKVHLYRTPAIASVGMAVSVDTSPTGQSISLKIHTGAAGQTLFSQMVTTPFTTTVTPSQDVTLSVEVYDGAQANLSLSSLVATPAAAPFDRAGFDVVFHFCGDLPFVGQTGGSLGYHNGLATAADRAAFVADLAGRVNALFPAQFKVKSAGVGKLFSNSQLSTISPVLVSAGVSRLALNTSALSALTGQGAAASDPTFGKAVDVFVLHSESTNTGVTGIAIADLAGGGGVMVGAGPRHGVVVRLFNANSIDGVTPRPLQDVANTLAHELGHFLRLFHTTEQNFQVDDILDTPAAVDSNGNGILDEPSPDANYVMFFRAGDKTLWSPMQIEAVQDYLSIRDH